MTLNSVMTADARYHCGTDLVKQRLYLGLCNCELSLVLVFTCFSFDRSGIWLPIETHYFASLLI